MSMDQVFGKIEYIRNERAKHIRVRIFPNGLKVTIPAIVTTQQAEDFIRSEQKAILAKQEKLKQKETNNPTILDENSILQTLSFKVQLKRKSRKDVFFSLKDGVLDIEFPELADCKDAKTQKYFWNGIDYFLRKEAKRLLPERTKHLADKHGFMFSDVKIQSSKSRWGSCSGRKSINLSFYLMLLPAHLIEYVILHELCHTKEMNHGTKFWQWMDKVTDGQSKNLRIELKKYNMPS